MFFKVVVLAASLISTAHAFTLLPSAGLENVRWREFPIRFRVNFQASPYGPEQTAQVLEEALGLWNAVGHSNLRAELGAPTQVTARELLSGASSETAVVFDQDFARDFPGGSQAILAVGTAIRHGDDYTQGLIVVNARIDPPAPDRLRVILAHEAGHAFGLGHSSDAGALMYPVAHALKQLSDDDAQGIGFLYPRKESVNSLPFGCGVVRTGSGGAGNGPLVFGGWLACVALLWSVFRGRRRPKFTPKSVVQEPQSRCIPFFSQSS